MDTAQAQALLATLEALSPEMRAQVLAAVVKAEADAAATKAAEEAKVAAAAQGKAAKAEAPKKPRTRRARPYHIEKLGKNRYRVRINLGVDPVTGKRKTFDKVIKGTREEAAEWAEERARERAQGDLVLPTPITLAQHAEDWLTTVAFLEKSEGTFVRYKGHLRRYFMKDIGHVRMEDLKPHLLQEQCARLAERLDPSTVRLAFIVLRQCLDYAVERKLLARNPCERIHLPKKRKAPKPVIPTEAVTAFLDEVIDTRHGAQFIVAVLSSMRPGEQQALQWSAIDWDRNAIQVARAAEWIPGDSDRGTIGRFEMKEPKTQAGYRTIVVPPFVMDLLRKHRAAQNEQRLKMGTLWHDNGLVFPDQWGKPFDRERVFSKHVKPVLKRHGLEGLTYRDLRKFAITILTKEKAPPTLLQQRLGHSNIHTTLQSYVYNSPGLQEQAADTLDNILNPARRRAVP